VVNIMFGTDTDLGSSNALERAAIGLTKSLLGSWAAFALTGDCANEDRAPSFDGRNMGAAVRDADSWGRGQMEHAYPLSKGTPEWKNYCLRDSLDVENSLRGIPRTVGIAGEHTVSDTGVINSVDNADHVMYKALHRLAILFINAAKYTWRQGGPILASDLNYPLTVPATLPNAGTLISLFQKKALTNVNEATDVAELRAFWTAMKDCVIASDAKALNDFESGTKVTETDYVAAKAAMKKIGVAQLKCGLAYLMDSDRTLLSGTSELNPKYVKDILAKPLAMLKAL